MSLVAAAIEQVGIPTVVLQFLRDITLKMKPPRALLVPYHHGYPLGEPHNVRLQKDILQHALNLLAHSGPPPVLETYSHSTNVEETQNVD